MKPTRLAARAILAAFYFAAGVLHLRNPDPFLLIVPSWVPAPRAVILITGIAEILGAVGLFVPPMRRAAGVGLALYAVCVLPANIKHAVAGIDVPGLPSSGWYHAPRILFQPVLVWWALYAGAVIDWPSRRRARRRIFSGG